MHAFLSTAGLARISARRPWLILGLWFVLLVGAAILSPTLGDHLTTQSTFSNSPESTRGQKLLEQRLRGPKPVTETIIVRSDRATVDDRAFQTTVDRVLAKLQAMPDLVAPTLNEAPLDNPALVSADRHELLIPVTLTVPLDDAVKRAPDFQAALAAAGAGDVQVMSVGDATLNAEYQKVSETDLGKGERIAIPIALVILVIVFGALVAAGLPILLGLASVFVAIGLTAIIARAMDLSFFVVNMIGMIGLAVGIDYALFIIERYREERRNGQMKLAAIERAGGTASKAVLFSGGTVILALLGMFLVPETTFRSLGLGAVLVVIVALAASLTLIPAAISLLGDRLDWPRRPGQRQPSAISAHGADQGGVWARLARLVMAHPVVCLTVSVALLLACALPYADFHEGSTGVSGLPRGSKTGAAFSVLQRDFPAGMVSPVEIVIDGNASDPAVQASIQRLTAALVDLGSFGPATITANKAGNLTLVSAPMTIAPDSAAAYDLVETLRNETIPTAFAGAHAEVSVTGVTAQAVDYTAMVDRYLPIVLAFVLGLSFILLLIAFRSIVVPATAIVMNLLSVGAAYGLMVLVFQKGVGNGLFGFQRTPAIESWIPLFLFCVLFGLSMDYHVFLLSRIREHFDLTGRNGESVASGLQATAKIITGAALIMVAVFTGFAAGRLVMFQQVGFGLAVAVFLDAAVIRSIVVPATMALLGDRNWYLPHWLGWLPKLHIEGAPAVLPLPASGDD
jgi:RND superfamily putative drug exporter